MSGGRGGYVRTVDIQKSTVTNDDHAADPFLITDPARLRLILVVVGLSLMMVVSAVSGLNIALPDVARDTGATQSQMQWIVDSYTVTLAALLFTSGAIGDRYGRRRLLVSGLALFGLAALGALFTHEPSWLIFYRALMGVGAAMVMPTTLSIITTSFPPERRPRAIGLWIGMASGGAVLGLVASGLLLEWFSWSSFFALNIVLAVLALVGAIAVVPNSVDAHPPRLDPVGGLLTILAVGGIVFATIEGPVQGWGSWMTLTSFAIGIVAGFGFVMWGLKTTDPLLDPRLFRLRGYATGSASNFIQFFAAFGFFYISSQYLQFVVGLSPLVTACAMLPMSIVVIPLSRLAPGLALRFGFNRVGALGLGAMAAGVAVFTTLQVDLDYWVFLVGLVIFGAGMALAGGPATTAITSALPREKQGIASSTNDTSRELGSALGIAVLGSVLNGVYRANLEPQLSNAPAAAVDAATASIAAAQDMATQLSVGGAELAAAADQAFVAGTTRAFAVGAVALALGAIFVLWRAPRQGADLQTGDMPQEETRPNEHNSHPQADTHN